MPDHPTSRVGTPLDRDQATLERAKGAVMFRYGVNSHVAFAMIARWSRSAEVPITTLAGALVEGTVDNDWLLDPD